MFSCAITSTRTSANNALVPLYIQTERHLTTSEKADRVVVYYTLLNYKRKYLYIKS